MEEYNIGDYMFFGIMSMLAILMSIAVLIKISMIMYRAYRFLIGKPLPKEIHQYKHTNSKGSYHRHPTWPGCSDDQSNQ